MALILGTLLSATFLAGCSSIPKGYDPERDCIWYYTPGRDQSELICDSDTKALRERWRHDEGFHASL